MGLSSLFILRRKSTGSLFFRSRGEKLGAFYSLYLKERGSESFLFSISRGEREREARDLYHLDLEEKEGPLYLKDREVRALYSFYL